MKWHCCVWLLLNTVFLRPFFTLLNLSSLAAWRCAPDGSLGGSSELQALVVGHGRTGTTSLALALRRLGLKTYKTIDTNFYLGEVIDRIDAMSAEQVAYRARSCGITALSLEQLPALLPKLLKAFPRVKVIYMQRDWHSWATSQRAVGPHHMPWQSLAASHLLCHWLPYGVVWPGEGIGSAFYEDSITSTFLVSCFLDLALIPYRPAALPFADHERAAIEGEEAFGEMANWVRELVPRGNLLEFDIKRHGWTELAAFLGRQQHVPDEPFPRLNVGSSSYQAAKAKLFPGTVFLFWAMMAFSVIVNWFAFLAVARLCCARSRSRAKKND